MRLSRLWWAPPLLVLTLVLPAVPAPVQQPSLEAVLEVARVHLERAQKEWAVVICDGMASRSPIAQRGFSLS
jgi:hypothetical protein